MTKACFIYTGKTFSGGGGAERRFLRTFQALKQTGSYEVFLLFNRSMFNSAIKSGLMAEGESNVIVIDDLPLIKTNIEIIKLINERGFSIVHFPLIQKSFAILYMYLLLSRSRIKVFQTIALSTLAHGTEKDKLLLFVDRIACILAVQIDSLYESILQNNRYARFHSKMLISPCSFTDYRKYEFEIKADKSIVLFCGRLIEEKNPEIFLNAIKKIDASIGFRYVVCGDGPLKGRLTELAEKLQISDRVAFTSMGDTSSLFKQSVIFVSLQKTENYPSQSLLEAMASGATVIATNVGETQRLVKDGYTGVLIDESAHDLAMAIQTLHDNPKHRQEMSISANDFVRENHNINIFSKYILNMWQDA